MFPVYGFRLTIVRPLCFDIFKVNSYDVTSRVIYEWGTCTGAIRLMVGNNVTNPNSNEYKLTAIVLDIADH
jgi:hypothetical protein